MPEKRYSTVPKTTLTTLPRRLESSLRNVGSSLSASNATSSSHACTPTSRWLTTHSGQPLSSSERNSGKCRDRGVPQHTATTNTTRRKHGHPLLRFETPEMVHAHTLDPGLSLPRRLSPPLLALQSRHHGCMAIACNSDRRCICLGSAAGHRRVTPHLLRRRLSFTHPMTQKRNPSTSAESCRQRHNTNADKGAEEYAVCQLLDHGNIGEEYAVCQLLDHALSRGQCCSTACTSYPPSPRYSPSRGSPPPAFFRPSGGP